MFQPGNLAGGAGFVPQLHGIHAGHLRLQDRLEQPRAERRRRVAAERAERLCSAACSAIPIRRRSGPATPSATAWSAWTGSRRSTATIRAARSRPTRNYTTGFPMLGPGETAPVLLRDRSRLGPPAFPASPVYPIAALPSNELNVFDAEHQHAVRAVLLGRPPAFARARHGARGPLRRQPQSPRLGRRGLERRRRSSRTASSTSSRRAQANLAAHVAQGCGATGTCSFAYRGPGTGTTPLPDLPRVFPGPELGAGSAPRRTTPARTSATRRGRGTSATTSRIRTTRPTTCTRT